MIRITNFDVGQADCFLLHFEKEKRYFNLLIDGAYVKNKIDEELCKKLGDEKIQGVVITHIDSDHIAGILSIVKKKFEAIDDAFFLFNKFDESLISYSQARELASEIQKNFSKNYLIKSYMKNYTEELNQEINSRFDKKKVLEVNLMSWGQRKKCDVLDGDMVNISILGPSHENIKKFMRNWNEEKENSYIINASSIVLLIEFDGMSMLMSGDGNFVDIEEKLKEIEVEKINVIKAAHHGAKNNNVRLKDIVKKYKCDEILFTISGQSDGKHPSIELLEAIKHDNKDIVLSCSADIMNDDLKSYLIRKNDIIIPMKGNETDE